MTNKSHYSQGSKELERSFYLVFKVSVSLRMTEQEEEKEIYCIKCKRNKKNSLFGTSFTVEGSESLLTKKAMTFKNDGIQVVDRICDSCMLGAIEAGKGSKEYKGMARLVGRILYQKEVEEIIKSEKEGYNSFRKYYE